MEHLFFVTFCLRLHQAIKTRCPANLWRTLCTWLRRVPRQSTALISRQGGIRPWVGGGSVIIYLLDKSSDVEAGERRLLGRLQHHRVSTCERWTQLPRCHHQREVPLRTHTHGPEKDIMHGTATLGGHKSSSISHRS